MTIRARGWKAHSLVRPLLILALALALSTVTAAAEAAAAEATPITGLPYSNSPDWDTAEAGFDTGTCITFYPTVWYSYTAPSDQELLASGDYPLATISVFTGSPDSLQTIQCTRTTPARFEVSAGQTIYIALSEADKLPHTFTLELAPPALDFEISVDDRAQLASGSAAIVVSGTVTCNHDTGEIPIFAGDGSVVQKQGRVTVRGDLNYGFLSFIHCSTSPRHWTTTVDPFTVTPFRSRFLPKPTTVTVHGYACDFAASCDEDTTTRTIRVTPR